MTDNNTDKSNAVREFLAEKSLFIAKHFYELMQDETAPVSDRMKAAMFLADAAMKPATETAKAEAVAEPHHLAGKTLKIVDMGEAIADMKPGDKISLVSGDKLAERLTSSSEYFKRLTKSGFHPGRQKSAPVRVIDSDAVNVEALQAWADKQATPKPASVTADDLRKEALNVLRGTVRGESRTDPVQWDAIRYQIENAEYLTRNAE